MSHIDQVPQKKIQPLTCLGNWLYGYGILGKEVKIVYSFAIMQTEVFVCSWVFLGGAKFAVCTDILSILSRYGVTIDLLEA
jgi:hypothetical protein